MHRVFPAAVLLALAACGGSGGPGPVDPGESAAASVQAFLQAAKDSNLVRMAELWGTSRGAAAQTRYPPDYQRRVQLMQVWLKGDSARVLGETPVAGDANRRTVTIALVRGTCVKNVPFTTVRSRDRWLVFEVDLNLAGNPARPCDPGTEGVPPAR
jgi:hypothetical protein